MLTKLDVCSYNGSLAITIVTAAILAPIALVGAANCGGANTPAAPSGGCWNDFQWALSFFENNEPWDYWQFNGWCLTAEQTAWNGAGNYYVTPALNDIWNQCMNNYWSTGAWEAGNQWYWIGWNYWVQGANQDNKRSEIPHERSLKIVGYNETEILSDDLLSDELRAKIGPGVKGKAVTAIYG